MIIFLTLTMAVSQQIESENDAELCGTSWKTKYTELHRNILEGRSQGRYIVAVPVKAGLADVLLGYTSAFLWALLTDR